MRYWERRNDLKPVTITPAEAIAKGLRVDGGPVIQVEAADCCGSGADGDSIATLLALVDQGIDLPAIVPVVNSKAAADCHAAGTVQNSRSRCCTSLPLAGIRRVDFADVVERLSDGESNHTGGQLEYGHV